jgi:hypothetical protein
MPQVLSLYKKYKITATLQEHQFRVAAVAQQICNNLNQLVDTKTIISACLLHDMGNILKFDLDKNLQWLEPQGKEYWEKVKQETAQKYGTTDEHLATMKIAEEIGVSSKILECMDNIGYVYAVGNKLKSLEIKICGYSDMRAAPSGVVTLAGRLQDGAKRYKGRIDASIINNKELSGALEDIEKDIFQKAKIRPNDITDESIAPIIEQLRTYEI